MGDNSPLAVLSILPYTLYNYFKQRFSQVTNPPIDPLREVLVMSLGMTLGKKEIVYTVSEKGARLIHLESPFLGANELKKIEEFGAKEHGGIKNNNISTGYDVTKGTAGFKKSINDLYKEAVKHFKSGFEVIIISDKDDELTTYQGTTYILPLDAIREVHHKCIEAGLCLNTGLMVETRSAWSIHHYACLVGYRANAVHPNLSLETVKQWYELPKTQKSMEVGKLVECTVEEAQENYRNAVEAGLLKILSKMCISLLASYTGAQLFEVLGVDKE